MAWSFRMVLVAVGAGSPCIADAASFTVTTVSDSGPGSLRQAILDANMASGPDTVEFDQSLDGQTIILTSDPLEIKDSLSVTGPGPDRLTIRSDDPELDLVQISGNAASVTLKGLALQGGEDGIQLSAGSNGNTVELTDIRVSRQLGDDALSVSGSLNRVRLTRSFLGESEDNISVDGTRNAVSAIETTIDRAKQDGIELEGDGNALILESSTISNNGMDAGSPNDGIDVDGSRNSVRLSQLTISTNGEDGVDIEGPGNKVSIRNSTITLNGRDGIKAQDATSTSVINLYSNIIAGNKGPDVDGAVISDGYNLVGAETGSGGFSAAGDQLGAAGHPIDARLGPLELHGGNTPVHAVLAGSPAIDSGDPGFAPPPDLDQRGQGFPRVQGGRVDIGAVEGATP